MPYLCSVCESMCAPGEALVEIIFAQSETIESENSAF